MVEVGVAAEQARMVLPQAMMTEWIWSGSLDAFASMCKLRLDPHTQYESRLVAEEISKHMSGWFPHSWKVLLENA
jgi:thymidylate synthase (FAD)